MPQLKDTITSLARRGRELDGQFETAHTNATGVETMSTDALADIYLASTYDERMEIFRSLIVEQGMDGLDAASKILRRAGKKYGGTR